MDKLLNLPVYKSCYNNNEGTWHVLYRSNNNNDFTVNTDCCLQMHKVLHLDVIGKLNFKSNDND